MFLILCLLIFGTIATTQAQEITGTAKRVLITNPNFDQLQVIQNAVLD